MKKQLKKVPDFQSEEEERAFWATHDTTEYVDWSQAHRPPPFPNLKPTEGLLEFVIPDADVENLESLAAKYHITKDALARKFVLEGLKREGEQARA